MQHCLRRDGAGTGCTPLLTSPREFTSGSMSCSWQGGTGGEFRSECHDPKCSHNNVLAKMSAGINPSGNHPPWSKCLLELFHDIKPQLGQNDSRQNTCKRNVKETKCYTKFTRRIYEKGKTSDVSCKFLSNNLLNESILSWTDFVQLHFVQVYFCHI